MSDSPSLLSHLDSDHLAKMRREMSPNPHDGTSYAHVVALLRSLISRELADPARQEADRARAEKVAEDARQKAADDLAAKQASERAANAIAPSGSPLTPAGEKAHAEMDARHAAEQRALKRQHRLADLDAEQARERNEFAKQQQEKRAQALAEDGDASAGPGDAGVEFSAPRSGPQFDQRSWQR